MNIKSWISAFRLKTLPLAFASILLGNLLAKSLGQFSWIIAILSLITTAFLQILSNLANDYGDAVNGVDNQHRIGPARAVQSGLISASQMKIGIYVFVILSLISGTLLLAFSFDNLLTNNFIMFFVVGIIAILAAINYTVGKRPYGYHGLGDLFVLLFFGWVAVLGTCYLHTMRIVPQMILPASSIGLLAVAVLNLNNMRDAIQDKVSGKITLAVRFGASKSKSYHMALIFTALFCSMAYMWKTYEQEYQWAYLLFSLPILLHARRVYNCKDHGSLDPELKKLAISTLLFSLAFGLAILAKDF